MYPACHSHSRHLPHPISWIPDLQHRAIPEYFSPMARAMRNRRFCSVLRDPERHVVFSSNCSLQDATAAYGPLQSHNHILRFTTVPLDSWFDDPGAVVARYQLPEKFFIICNQFWMHKDHRTAFRALSKLKYRGIKAHLVCTGPTHDNRRPDYFPKLLNEIRDLGIQDQVHILGTIPRIDQVALIRAAQAVIQPSCFEGWSTVIEDARALGRPVIASDFPVHLEQAAPLSSFFRLGDAADCARAMVEQVSTKRTSSYTLARHRARILEFARSFLKIVESACATSHSRETLIA